MEILILICLLVVIALLAKDKIVTYKNKEQKQAQEKLNPSLPDIMGQPKTMRRLLAPNTANENQIQEPEVDPQNLDIEYDKNENVSIQISQEEMDEVFTNIPDFEQEEEEWYSYGISGGENGFAQGVTFEELGSVAMLLQKENLQPYQKEKAKAIVQKIQGTELLSILENSIKNASSKIAGLLDGRLTSEIYPDSSALRKNDLDGFDIGEFV